MKLNQKGFGAVEGLLVVIALTLVVGVGFYVFNANKDKDDSKSSQQTSSQKVVSDEHDPYSGWQTYTNSEFNFTLKYPAEWTFKDSEQARIYSEDGQSSEPATDSDGKPILNPAKFISKADLNKNIGITPGKTTYTDPKAAWENEGSGRAGDVVESKTETINDYSAYFVKAKHMGNTMAVYILVHNGVSFDLYTSASNSSGDIATLDKIAKSVKFN